MPMAMCKEGLHRDQRGAFWCRWKKEEMGRKTDYTTTKDSGIQRNRDRMETETDAIYRDNTLRSNLSPTVILRNRRDKYTLDEFNKRDARICSTQNVSYSLAYSHDK